MGAGASASAADVDVDVIDDHLSPIGWTRVLRADSIEAYVPDEQLKKAGRLHGYYAEKAVAWHLDPAVARAGGEPKGVIARGSGVLGLQLDGPHADDPLGRVFARFLAEVGPKVEMEGIDPAKVMGADPASIHNAEEQRPDEFRVMEVWVRVPNPDGTTAKDSMFAFSPSFAATVVDIATANNPWPIPAVLEPVPDPVRALSSCPPILLRFRCR